MRLNEEEESRALTFDYDLELLRSELDNGEAKPVTDLLMMLELAAAENLPVDVALLGRSYLTSVRSVTRRNPKTGSGVFERDRFIKELSPWLARAAEIAAAEKEIFGEAGFPPVNIFGGNDLPATPGRLSLVGLSEKNREPSRGIFKQLQARGKLVASVGEGRDKHR